MKNIQSNLEVQSLIRHIKKSNSLELSEITEMVILEWESLPLAVYFTLKQRFLNGTYIPEQLAAQLIVKSMSKTLYESMHFSGVDAQLTLFKGGVPDHSIEKNLSEKVSSDIRAEHYGSNELILDALKHYGSTACLSVLTVLEYDTKISNQVDRINLEIVDANNLTLLNRHNLDHYAKRITSKLNLKLGSLLSEAILEIQNRGDSWSENVRDWKTI